MVSPLVLYCVLQYKSFHFIIIIRHDFALNIKIVFLFCCCWPLQHFKCVHIFTYLFIIRYGSLLCPRSSACRNNTGVNATDSSKINWYVSFRKPLQDGLKDILFMCCNYMQMHLLFHGLQGVDFLGKQTRSTVGNTGERFRFQWPWT